MWPGVGYWGLLLLFGVRVLMLLRSGRLCARLFFLFLFLFVFEWSQLDLHCHEARKFLRAFPGGCCSHVVVRACVIFLQALRLGASPGRLCFFLTRRGCFSDKSELHYRCCCCHNYFSFSWQHWELYSDIGGEPLDSLAWSLLHLDVLLSSPASMFCLHPHSSLYTGTLGTHMVSILGRLSITGRSGAFASFFAMWEKTRSISCGNKLIWCCSSQGSSSLFAQSTFVYLLAVERSGELKIFLPLWIWSASSDHLKWEQKVWHIWCGLLRSASLTFVPEEVAPT